MARYQFETAQRWADCVCAIQSHGNQMGHGLPIRPQRAYNACEHRLRRNGLKHRLLQRNRYTEPMSTQRLPGRLRAWLPQGSAGSSPVSGTVQRRGLRQSGVNPSFFRCLRWGHFGASPSVALHSCRLSSALALIGGQNGLCRETRGLVGHTTEEMRKRYTHLYPSAEKLAIQLVFSDQA